AQVLCQDYFDVYNTFPLLDTFISNFSLDIQEFTQSSGLRPFGTFLMFCGLSKNGPAVYTLDPSGSFSTPPIAASGQGYESARGFLSRRQELLDDNIVNAVLALQNYCGKVVEHNDVSIGVYEKSKSAFRVYSPEDVKEIFESMH
ncbi:20S proteasome subunit alpha 2, partial [Enteropsectra breve]